MKDRPCSVTAMSVFIILNIIFWVAYGVIVVFNLHPALPDQPLIKGIMAILSFVAAGFLLWAFVFLKRHNRVAYYLALTFFCIAILFTIFDEVGWVDLVVFAINVIPLILLIKDRGWYLQPEPRAVEG
jgi:hypothetical protein